MRRDGAAEHSQDGDDADSAVFSHLGPNRLLARPAVL
jgi:hypothetical protein